MSTRDVSDYRSAVAPEPLSAETWGELDDAIRSMARDFTTFETTTAWVDDALERDDGSPLDPYTKDLRHLEAKLDAILTVAAEHDQKRALDYQARVRALEKQATHLQRVFEGKEKDADGVGPVPKMNAEDVDADDTRKLKLVALGIGVATLLNGKCWWLVLSNLGPLFTDPGSETAAIAWGAVMAMVWSYPFTVLGVTRFLYPEWMVYSDNRDRNFVHHRGSGNISRGWSIALVVLGQLATAIFTFFA